VGIKEWKSIAFRKLRNITIVLDRIPEPEKSGDRYFIAGDFNNWQPGDMAYVFKNDLAGKPYVNISTDQAIISFKITRGTWNTVETRPSGEDIENRTFICGQDDTLKLKVERWKDRAYKPTISKPQ
jgi:alpha-glucosidase